MPARPRPSVTVGWLQGNLQRVIRSERNSEPPGFHGFFKKFPQTGICIQDGRRVVSNTEDTPKVVKEVDSAHIISPSMSKVEDEL